jgi:hypothetical protein
VVCLALPPTTPAMPSSAISRSRCSGLPGGLRAGAAARSCRPSDLIVVVPHPPDLDLELLITPLALEGWRCLAA